MEKIKHRICKKCWIEHVENCDKCFGFGLMERFDRIGSGVFSIPISARKAFEWEDRPYKKCPECGGTPFGINYDKDKNR